MSLQTDDLASWIKTYHWDNFHTVTCRRQRVDAIALMRDIYNELTRPDTKFWSDPDGFHVPYRAFIACEPHKFSHFLHAHLITRGGPTMYDPTVQNKALEKRFGYSRSEVCRSASNIASYCSKYVTKLTDGDNYDFFGNWERGKND